MIKAIIILAAVTLIPALELRASIPCGILPIPIPLLDITVNEYLSWPATVLVCVVVNIILGWIVFLVMGPVFTFVRKWGWFDRKVWPILERTQHKIHPYVEKYGEFGVAVFMTALCLLILHGAVGDDSLIAKLFLKGTHGH
jgi:uncharacterized membrane protein